MEIVYYVCFFILGTLIGSFCGVVGMRMPVNKSFVKGRSYCDHCHHTLGAIDLIPLFSFAFTGGKCRYCGKDIPKILPLTELASGILFMVSYYSFGFSIDLVLALFIVSLLIIVLVSDFTYFIIPDEVLLFFSIAFIIIQVFRVGFYNTLLHICNGIFLFFLMYLILLVGNKLFKRESMGGADVKIMFLFGLVLDPLLGVLTIFLGSFIALPISIVLYYVSRDKIIPFGPFLTLAFLFMYFTKITTPEILHFLGIY